MEYQDLLKLAESIANYMEGWRADRRPVPQDHRHQGATLLGDQGKAIRLYQSYQSKGKVTVRGICPDYGLNHCERRNASLPHGSESINVSPARNPKHIAADIERRLLPGYEAILPEAAKRAQEYKKRVSTLEHIEHALLDVAPELRPYQQNDGSSERRYYIYGKDNQPFRSGEIRISSYGCYSCDLDLNDVPLSTTFQILALLRNDT